MDMKHRIIILLTGLLAFAITSCMENNIGYDEQINVGEGIYISGSATEFSAEVPKGALKSVADTTLYALKVWLKPTGNFYISFVSDDGQPQSFGRGEAVQGQKGVAAYLLRRNGDALTIQKEGLYDVVVNRSRHEVNIIPIDFKMVGEVSLTEDGNNTIDLQAPIYDHLHHLVTWKTSDTQQLIQASEYNFCLITPEVVHVTDTQTDTLATTYTGTSSNVRSNVLTADYADLTHTSATNLKLKNKGNYIVSIQYDVLADRFSAKIDGEPIIEPEAQGYPVNLYMSGDNFGGWSSGRMVKMVPVGVEGNGAFWCINHFTAGKSIEWSTDKTGADSFAKLTSNVGITIDAQGHVSVKQTGWYTVFVDLYHKIISFESPEIYGIGKCFNDEEVPLAFNGDELIVRTQADGDLKMFAVSKINNRDWQSMLFTVRDGRISYQGVSKTEHPMPVAANTTVKLNFATGEGLLDRSLMGKNVPEQADAIYMIGDDFGQMDWASDGVQTFDRSYSENYRWFYINYFKAGSGLRFSTKKCFGEGEFVQLDENGGFEVNDGKAVIQKDGIYMIYIDLALRLVYIQPANVYGYCESTKFVFTADTDGKTMSAVLPGSGRVRMYAKSPIMSDSRIKKFSEWKRELYVDPVTGELSFRKPGSNEPNKDYKWKEGTKITLDFLAHKGIIVTP